MQWFLRRHAFPGSQIRCLPALLQIVLAVLQPPEPRACLGYNYRLGESFTFPEVLPLCVALLALPRKAGVAILTGFAQPLRPSLIADQTSKEFSPPACAPSAQPG